MEDGNITTDVDFNPFNNKVTRYIHSCIITIILVVSIVWNLLLLICVVKFTFLRKRRHALSIHLLAINLFLAILCGIYTLYFRMVTGQCRPFLENLLVSAGLFSVLMASLLNMVFIALDKFLLINYPFKYDQWVTKRTTIVSAITIWVAPVVVILTTIPDFIRHSSDEFCTDNDVAISQFDITMLCLIAFVLLLMIFINYKILHLAKKAKQRISMEKNAVSSQENQPSSSKDSTSTNGTKFINFSLAGASVLFTPYFLLSMLIYTGSGSLTLLGILSMITMQCVYTYTGLGALVYTLYCADFNKAIRKLLCYVFKNG